MLIDDYKTKVTYLVLIVMIFFLSSVLQCNQFVIVSLKKENLAMFFLFPQLFV